MKIQVGDRVRHEEHDGEGIVTKLESSRYTGQPGAWVASERLGECFWYVANLIPVPDWFGPALTPEEEGVTSTIQREPELLPAFERAVAEQGLKTSPFEYKVVALFTEAADLLLRKHRDYGPSNIARAPGGALNGLRVRLHDKTARLNHLLDSGQDPEFETLIDTLMDIANYGLIGVLVQRGDWPDE